MSAILDDLRVGTILLQFILYVRLLTQYMTFNSLKCQYNSSKSMTTLIEEDHTYVWKLFIPLTQDDTLSDFVPNGKRDINLILVSFIFFCCIILIKLLIDNLVIYIRAKSS